MTRKVPFLCMALIPAVLIFFNDHVQADSRNSENRWLFSLQPSTLSELLPQITGQTGLQFSYETRVLREHGNKVGAIDGNYSVDELMQQLLAGSTLEYVYDGDRTVVLRLKADWKSGYKPDIQPLSEEVVVLGRYGVSNEEKLAAQVTITSVQTEYLPQAGLVNASLLNIPDLLINNSDSRLRISRASRNMRFDGAYEDGLPLLFNNPLNFGNMDEYLRLDESIGRIEVRRGGTGAVMMENGLGTVLGLVNKYDMPLTPDTRSVVKYTAADDGLRRSDIYINTALNEWDFYVSALYFDSYELQDVDVDTVEGEGKQLTVGLRRYWPGGRFSVKYRNVSDIGPVVIQSNDFLLSAFDGVNIEQNYLSTGLDIDLSDNWSFWHRLSQTKANIHTIINVAGGISQSPQIIPGIPVPSDVSMAIRKPVDYLVQDMRFQRSGEQHNITLGFFYSDQQSDRFSIEQAGPVNPQLYTRYEYQLDNKALYAMDSWQLNGTWRMDAGFRAVEISYQYQNEYTLPSYDPAMPMPVSGAKSRDETFQRMNYTFGMNYMLSDNASLLGYLSKGFRGVNVDVMLFSDELLKPETYKALELGYRRFTDNLDISATFFKTKSDDDGITHNLNFFGIIGETNRPESGSVGFDTEVIWRPYDLLQLSFYTGVYQGEFPDAGNAALSAITVDKDQSDQFRVSPLLKFGRGNIYLNYRYVAQTIHYESDDSLSPDYATIDLGMRYSFSDNLVLHVIGRNLTGEKGINSGLVPDNTTGRLPDDSTFVPLIRERTIGANLAYYFY